MKRKITKLVLSGAAVLGSSQVYCFWNFLSCLCSHRDNQMQAISCSQLPSLSKIKQKLAHLPALASIFSSSSYQGE